MKRFVDRFVILSNEVDIKMFGKTIQQIPLRELHSEDIEGFYYMIDIKNLDSILKNGIYSHNAVRNSGLYSDRNDISNSNVQQCRERTFNSPGSHTSRKLHDYVNFYLQPRNAMLFAVQKDTPISNLCILKIKKELLRDRTDAILTNRNAACYSAKNEAKFFKEDQWVMSPASSTALSSRSVFGNSTRNQSRDTVNDYKQKRQAEALFLHHVPAEYISEIIAKDEFSFQNISACVHDAKRANDINVRTLPSVFRASDDASRDIRLNFLDFAENKHKKENRVPNVPVNQTWLQSPAPSSPSPKTVTFFGTSSSSVLIAPSSPLPFIYDISDNDDTDNSQANDGPATKLQRKQ